ncbi:cell division protein ZapA [Streptococcus devriesei]|uniref:cell division protein ZapA n=1 Tax=Streptococcus devriesei TaxID=231233 RepID=UPI0003FA8CB7|nr:cell division protein ZapA [Streptococcus devriesei]
MTSKNRYKFTFGEKTLTLTTDKDNLFMEEIERVAKEKYDAIKEKLPQADDETIAILMAINALSTQLSREIDFDKKEEELEKFRTKELSLLKGRAQRSGDKK